MIRKRLGDYGEEMACLFLKKQGYRIIERNFRCNLGEIDLIAEDFDEIVIAEVRSTSKSSSCDPLESISYKKIRRLYTLAYIWVKYRRKENRKLRFDVIGVHIRSEFRRDIEIKHIKNAI